MNSTVGIIQEKVLTFLYSLLSDSRLNWSFTQKFMSLTRVSYISHTSYIQVFFPEKSCIAIISQNIFNLIMRITKLFHNHRGIDDLSCNHLYEHVMLQNSVRSNSLDAINSLADFVQISCVKYVQSCKEKQ